MFTSPLDYLRQTLAAHRDKTVYSDGERSLTFAQVADLALAAASFLVGHTKPRTGVVVMSGRHVLTLHLIGQFNFTDFEFVDAKR